MGAPEILVTGGTGMLGSRVVERLRAEGRAVRVMSHGGRPGTVGGDLLTGEGLKAAVEGVETVVHCASSPIRKSRRTDVGGTAMLLRAVERAGVSHFVFVSIVGVDRNPYYPYYRVKLDTEGIVEGSPVPWTILRATQFHDFVLGFLRPLTRLPVVPVPGDLWSQPIDVGEAAGRLAELALAPPAGRVPDIGGPEVRTFADLARAYLRAVGESKRVVEVPIPGKAARAWRAGAQTCPENRCGRIRWEEFLDRTLHGSPVAEARAPHRPPSRP